MAGEKVRIGKDSDGGYVLLRRQVSDTALLLSFGVATDWSFEEHFSRENPSIRIQMYDYSTSFGRIVATALAKTAKLDLVKAGHYFEAMIRYIAFISANPRVALKRQFLATADGAKTVSFDTIMASVIRSGVTPESVFVKLDIEGSEYDVLDAVARHGRYINGLAIEFHDLDRQGGRLDEAMRLLRRDFHVVHVHGNNYCPLIPATPLPTALEVTLVRKSAPDEDLPADPATFPLAGLDFPNHPDRIDFPLNFQ